MGSFTEAVVGKRVVAQGGSTVGEVADVRDGTLYVEVAAGIDRDVEGELRWDGPVNREVRKLEDEFVSTVDGDVVRLRV